MDIIMLGPTAGSNGGINYTRRYIINPIAQQATATLIKVRFAYAGMSYTAANCWIGLQATSGDVWDIDPSTLTQVTVGGASSAVIASVDVYSDEISLLVDMSRAIVFSTFSATAQPYSDSRPTGVYAYHKAINEAGVSDVTGYTASTGGIVTLFGLYSVVDTDISVYSVLDQPYSDASIIATGLYQPLGLIMEGILRQMYGDAATPIAGLVARYGDAAQVLRALEQRYGQSLPVLAALDQRYTLMHQVVAAIAQQYAIASAEVLAVLEQRYDLRQREQIIAALVEHYSMMAESSTVGLSFAVLVGGVDITRIQAATTWTISEDAYLIEANITLFDQATYRTLAVGDAVEIRWQGTTYHLFLANKRRSSRRIDGEPGAYSYAVEYVLTCRSLTAGLDAPYALPVTMEWSAPRMASAIAADLLGSLADIISIDWQCEDWLQPGSTFFVTDEAPLSGLRKLAGIIGAILLTSADNALIIRMPDAVPPAEWATCVPSTVISDNGGLFADAESEEESMRYNCITVSNQQESESGARFEIDDITEYRKRVKGYRIPWADFALATSGGLWVAIEDEGVRTEQITEQVEFVDGASSASKPIYSQVAVDWIQTQLGGVTAAEDGSLTAEVSGCSLASITYTTKYHSWIGADNRDEDVQFYEVPL